MIPGGQKIEVEICMIMCDHKHDCRRCGAGVVATHVVRAKALGYEIPVCTACIDELYAVPSCEKANKEN